MAKHDNKTLDLFAWHPPKEVVRRFDPERVKGQRFNSLLARGVSEAMAESGKSRAEIVECMREYLGDDLAGNLSENILNGYASEARADAVINAVRLAALIHATGDPRLLNLFAEPNGFIVIDKKYLPAIHEAMIADEMEQKEKELQLLAQKKKQARNGWKGEL